MRATALTFLFLLAAATASFADITTDLVAYWPFSGGTSDESGNGNHGMNLGATLTTDRFGAQDAAYHFDGFSSRIDVPSSSSLASPTDALSISAWIRRDGWGSAGNGYNPIVTKSTTTPNAFQYRLITGTFGLSLALGDWNVGFTSAYDFQVDDWYHVCTTWEADTISTYVNGLLLERAALPTTITPDNRDLSIGSDTPGVLEIFYGDIDEVRIYARALSPLDVVELAGGPTGVPLPAALPPALTLGPAAPNPFASSTTIPFSLATRSFVRVEILDLAGRRVRQLAARDLAGGAHVVRWDGRDARGAAVASGVYVYRLATPGTAQSGKILVRR